MSRYKLFALLLFSILLPLSKASATSTGAYNNLDAAVEKILSSRLFLQDDIDYPAADNGLRKAKADVVKAVGQAGKGEFKLTGAKLQAFNATTTKIQTALDSGRGAIKSKNATKAIQFIDKAINSLRTAMLPLAGLTKTSPCVNTFTVNGFAGVPDVYSGHIVVNCPFIYDEVIGSIAGEIGSLSYGYSYDGRTEETASSCSQNLLSSGVCEGVPGRPGGYYRMKINVYLVGDPPPTAYITLKLHGLEVASMAISVE